MLARWAFLAGMSWVNHLDLDPESGSFVDDELCELVERPAILGAVVFAGRSPTTCACRALSDALKGFNSDRCYTLFVGVVHNLAGHLVVNILHPAAFLVLRPLDGLLLFEALELLSSGVELPALISHLPPIAIEASRLTSNVGNRWDLDACIYSHDNFTLLRLNIWDGGGGISYPFLALPLDTKNALFSHWHLPTTGDFDLSGFGPIPHGDDECSPQASFFVRSVLTHLQLPVLVIPLGKGLFENGNTAKLEGSVIDRLSITDDLVLDRTW
jgi:hypothetical protein